MSTLTIELKLGSNAGYAVPDGMIGYWIKGIPECVAQPTKDEVLRAVGNLFTDIEVKDNYQTGRRNITMIALPRYKPNRPTTETKEAFLQNLAKIMQARET